MRWALLFQFRDVDRPKSFSESLGIFFEKAGYRSDPLIHMGNDRLLAYPGFVGQFVNAPAAFLPQPVYVPANGRACFAPCALRCFRSVLSGLFTAFSEDLTA